uniref:Ropporin-1-like protein n=1 Tax=Strigamia maritima TaxID=126957 RepID=T1IXW9_STRMM
MPAPEGPMYSTQQINIPAELPDILKQFTKAAIRTQPKDLLVWYFRALANGEKPPVKERIELPEGKSGLTIGLLRILHRQLGDYKTVTLSNLSRRWDGLCLDATRLNDLITAGDFTREVDWTKFMALACDSIAKDLNDAMKIFCEVFTEDPAGGAASIPFPVFAEILHYLSKQDNRMSQEKLNSALEYLKIQSDKQDGMVTPRNLQSLQLQ